MPFIYKILRMLSKTLMRKQYRDPVLENIARELLRKVGCHELAKIIRVEWNPRMRTTAGMACYQRRAILLNPKILEVAPHEVQRTLRHELAHFVAQWRVGRRRIEPHGAEWRKACGDLGIPNEPRCHNIPLKMRRLPRRYFYQCGHCGTVLARVYAPRRKIACLRCCRKHNDGRYSERFRFELIEAPAKLAA